MALYQEGFGRAGVFLMRRLEVGLGALAVVRLSVGGLLSVTATVFLPPPAIDSSKAVGCIFYCSMLASNVYLVEGAYTCSTTGYSAVLHLTTR